MITGIRRCRPLDLGYRAGPCQRQTGDGVFVATRVLRQVFDGIAIVIAGAEIHLVVRTIGAQQLVYGAHTIEPVLPVVVRNQAEAGDQVAHGDIGGRLAMMFFVDGGFEIMAERADLLAKPVERCHVDGIAISQALDELHGKRQLNVLNGIGREVFLQVGGLGAVLDEAVGQIVGCRACAPRRDVAYRNARQILDHDEPQADGSRPQLANVKRPHLLVCIDEFGQHKRVKAAVGVGHIGPGNSEDLRMTGQRPGVDLR